MRSWGNDAVGRVRAAWRGTARRERFLLGVFALIALAAATVSALDWSAGRREAHALALAEAADRRDGAVRSAARLSPQARRDLRVLSQRAIVAPDVWMARIAVEQRLAAAATQAGLTVPRLIVGEVDEQAPPPSVLTAEVTAPYDGAALVAFLERLESETLVFVDRLEGDRAENGEVVLALSFPVVLDAASPT